jgi:hypothetical protein
MPGIIETILIEEFQKKESFSRRELFEFFRSFEPDLKEGTSAWRIHNLQNKNIIKSLKRGVYTISYKPVYKPVLAPELIKLARKVQEKFEGIKYCVWDTGWLNEFSQHQSGKRMFIIDIEKNFVESLYYYLKDIFKYDLYLNPDNKAIEFYVSESNHPLIIKNLITRSPVGKIKENKLVVLTPLLEKILVDLFADENLFYFYQGSELIHIYESAINNYSVNFTKLFGYAKRRGKENEIKSFIKNNMNHLVKDIIDD